MTPEMIVGVLFARFVVLLVTRLPQPGERRLTAKTAEAPRWHDGFDCPA